MPDAPISAEVSSVAKKESSKQPLPCGTWPSRVTVDLVAGKTRTLSEVSVDGTVVYWLERRPSEKGRTVLMRWCEVSGSQEVLPPECDVATRVHEYGGGAYAVRNGQVVFSDKRTGGLWGLLAEDATPVCLAPGEGLRYADLRFDQAGHTVLAVREDHRIQGEPKAALVAVPVGSDPVGKGAVLYTGPDFLSSPALSPDGAFLAWIEWDHPNMPWDATRLCLARVVRDAQGQIRALEDRRVLAGEAQAESILEPRWTDDGRLLVISDRSGSWTVWQVEQPILSLHKSAQQADAPLSGLTPLPMPEGEIGQPAWVFGQRSYQPLPQGSILVLAVREGVTHCLCVSREGTVTPFVAHPEQCPVPLANGHFAWLEAPSDALPTVVVGTVQNGVQQVLQHSAALTLSSDDISRPETIRFAVEEGGEPLGHAFFYPPANSAARVPEGERSPMIVLVHGGPTARAQEGLSFKVQWWTSRGFAVLDVNYGGSTGFGRQWRERLKGAWGVVDVADCIAACQHMVKTGRIDPARIAIRGSSAGGMTVLVALASSSLFAAGVSLYGVTDLRALAQETHKFEARYLDGLIGPWPEAESVYLARSPLSVAARIRAPVLLLQGTEDQVVPPAQAYAMADALKAAGTPCILHEFPGEGHGFRQESTIRKAWKEELAFYGQVFGFQPQG